MFREPQRYLQLCKEAKNHISINKSPKEEHGVFVCCSHIFHGLTVGFWMDKPKGKKLFR